MSERLKDLFKIAIPREPEWGVNRFPDGQIQFWIEGNYHEPAKLLASIPDPEALDLFGQILRTINVGECQVNYFYGARSDKHQSGSRKVCNVAARFCGLLSNHVSGLLSWVNCPTAFTLVNPHCDELIAQFFEDKSNPSILIPVHPDILSNDPGYEAFIFPDESAYRRMSKFVPSGVSALMCRKVRDQVTGDIVNHEIPGVEGFRKLLVLDDLCDGGRSFFDIGMAAKCPHIDLYVTHGVFSNGAVDRLLNPYTRIWVTNSLPSAIKECDQHRARMSILDVWS